VHFASVPAGGFAANCYLVWEETSRRAALIDPSAAAAAVSDALRERSLTLTHILLTHVHFDHILTLEALRAAFGVPVCVHAADAAALGDPIANVSSYLFHERLVCHDADHLLADGEEIRLGGGTLTVLHTPGHTPGSVVYRADGLLFTGDTLFDGSVGRTDLPGGDAGALRASLCRLAALPPETVICPGHGGTSTIGRQIRTNPFL